MSFEAKERNIIWPIDDYEEDQSSLKSIDLKTVGVKNDKFNKLTTLVSQLFEYNDSREFFDISNFIILFLYTFDKNYPIEFFLKGKEKIFEQIKDELNNILTHEFSNVKNKYLLTLKVLRFFSDNTPSLTMTQKSEYAKVERHFMKLYLKDLKDILFKK